MKIRTVAHQRLKDTLSGETLPKLFLFPSEKGSTLKKIMLSLGAIISY